MDRVLALYRYAEQHNIDITKLSMRRAKSLSAPIFDGYVVALDPGKIKTIAEEYCALVHEIKGHCDNHAFYNQFASCDIKAKKENIADRAAIEYTLTADDLDAAVADGYTTIWDLAEHFGVTEDFMRKIVCYYTYGNLDCKDYLPM